MTKLDSGDQRRNVYMTDMKQKIPQISDWCQFLGNNQNKTDLITEIAGQFKTDKVRYKSLYPITIKEDETLY